MYKVRNITSNVSSTIFTNRPLGYIARQLAQKSLNRNLDFMRASLLASVNPLVSTDIPQIAGLTEIQKESVLSFSEERVSQENQEEMEANLLDSILALNKKMSHQLGLIVNAEQSSSILIRQATATSIKQTENTDPSSVITVEWKLRQPFQINVVREQKVQVDDVTTESDWLYQQLSSVELNLLNEFNDRAQEAVLLVLESLALDI